MNINNLYYVNLISSNPNPHIDDDNVEVTVSVYDFNNKPLNNISLNISVDKGYFTNYKRNNTNTVISDTSTKTYTGITGTDGSFKMTYTASEWGLCTFQCDVQKTQIYVTGYRTYTKTNGGISSTNDSMFSVDESSRSCRLGWYHTRTSITNESKIIDTITLPKREYYTDTVIYAQDYRSDISHYMYPAGSILVRNDSSADGTNYMTNHWVYFKWHY